MTNRKLELAVGAFLAAGLIAFLVLVFKVADIDPRAHNNVYYLTAKFDNIGSLKERSPVKVGGVVVGRVAKIDLDPELLIPEVTLAIETRFNQFSDNSSASILTSGLLGEQYIGLTPGFIDDESEILEDGGRLEDTRSAMVLEELIGQFLYSAGKE
ncbi:outer membrane lipid asymmetry maintenance protein MlaD [Ferrimonas sp. YFM]|uniref:outer membrane lipid asymmetry maintenance protein MlaD n=1 Tax=Ferrimonas sp. YFM TaxID=3028878 RepID=UPI002572980C|nr:outer membrane lipid asymmetry maintenance protein MlaD [Ferrimonas sp. YFM]BDY06706.1 outer membrane lipid asymmetry maintenance protein MlaD [Ferrimonas sp. YFM]